MSRKKRQPKVYISDRRARGIRVSYSVLGGPSAHMVYEIYYSDGTRTLERGHSLFASAGPGMDSNDPRNDHAPDLYNTTVACAHLCRVLEDACTQLDRKRGMHEGLLDKKGKPRKDY